MRLSWNRVRTFFFITIVLGVISGIAIGLYFGQPQMQKGLITSFGVTVNVWEKFHIEVSPMGYPIAGQSWTIFVYSTNVTSDGTFLTPLPNSTISVSVNDNGRKLVYQLTTDSKGQAEFQYLPSYDDVAFQVFEGDYISQKIVVSKHFVSSNIVDTIMLANGAFSLAVGVCTGLLKQRYKINKVLTALFIAVLALFAVICLSALYCRFYLETPWGCPEILIENYVSLDVLMYVTFFGFASLFALILVTIVVIIKQS